jgi:class 3 adenylate cyclase
MDGAIIFISSHDYNLSDFDATLAREGYGELATVECRSMEEAEPLLFEYSVLLIIAEAELSGVIEFVREMRADDAVKHIPVLALVDECEESTVRQVLDAGFDTYLQKGKVERLLLPHVRPLLRHNILNHRMLGKISDLQEKTVHDFLQLDLIKNYIPRTLWDIAQDFAHRQKIEIPEEELELTIVFGDLTEFTPRTQRMNPEDVIAYLNTAFEVVTRWVYEYAGDIDKFIGDAFLGVFADPESAVQAMTEVQQELREMNEERSQKGMETMQFRIGIHTGPVIRGNVGGNERYDNTLIGDTVNIAARLEQIASPGGITVSGQTCALTDFQITRKQQRTVNLKGRTGDIEVYDLDDLLVSNRSEGLLSERH